jgi:hypothetical protein
MEIRKSLSSGIGWAPVWPAETCTFCSRTALTMSDAVTPSAAACCGSTQMRMALCRLHLPI